MNTPGVLLNSSRVPMGEIQIPFRVISSAGAILLTLRTIWSIRFSIDTWRSPPYLRRSSARGGERATEFTVLSRILKVKPACRLGPHPDSTAQGRWTLPRLCGFSDGKVPAHNTYSGLRQALGVKGYAEIMTVLFVCPRARSARSRLPVLRRIARGPIVIADSTTIQAYCSTSGKKQPDGTWLFTDRSVAFGRPHHRDKFPIGHRLIP